MQVTLLGTGCPQCSTRRYGPANLVRHAGATVLVDCGSGVTQRLLGAGSAGRELDAVLLTHLHSDHVVDLYQLIVSAWHQGRDRPQRIFGPRGTRAYVEGLMALWRAEREQRIAHERRPSTAALEVEVTEFDGGPLLELGALRIAAVEVEHPPLAHAFGFVFEAPGEKAVLSGDTRACDSLLAAAAGADLLVQECFIHRALQPRAGVRTAATIAAVASYHTLSSEVGKIAARAGVAVLMLNHFVPTDFDEDALLAEVAADFAGPIVVGEDLMTYDLARGTLACGAARLKLRRDGPEAR